jgi:hypothetical protein
MASADDFGAIGMPASPHRSGREFTLGMLVCEADSFHRSTALPLSADSGRSPVMGRTRQTDPERPFASCDGLSRREQKATIRAAPSRGENGGRKPKMTPAKLRLALAALDKRGTIVAGRRREPSIAARPYIATSPPSEISGRPGSGSSAMAGVPRERSAADAIIVVRRRAHRATARRKPATWDISRAQCQPVRSARTTLEAMPVQVIAGPV